MGGKLENVTKKSKADLIRIFDQLFLSNEFRDNETEEKGATEASKEVTVPGEERPGRGADFPANNGPELMTASDDSGQLRGHAPSIGIAETLGSAAQVSSGQYIASFLLHQSLNQMLIVMHPEEAQTTDRAMIWSYVDWTGLQAWPEEQWLMYASKGRFKVPSLKGGKANKAQLKVSLVRTTGTSSLICKHLFDFCKSELQRMVIPLVEWGGASCATVTVQVSLSGVPHEIASAGHKLFLFGEEMHEQLRLEVEIDSLPEIGNLVLTVPLRALYSSQGFWPIPPHLLLFDTIIAGCSGGMALSKVIDRMNRLLAVSSARDGEDDGFLRWSGDAFMRLEYWGSDAKMLHGAKKWTVPWMLDCPVPCSRPDSRAWAPSSGSVAEARRECNARELYRWISQTLVLEARKLGHAAELDFVRIVRHPDCICFCP
jgi:hypothetical protein